MGSWLVVSSSLIVLCSALLFAIWPLPETIALRRILLGIGFITSLMLLQTDKSAIFNVAAWPLWVFLGFYPWLLVHLFLFSTDFNAQLYELGHLWMRSLLAVPLGLALGLMLVKTRILSVQTESGVLADNFWGNICILLILIDFSGTCLIGFGRHAYEVWLTHQGI